MFIYVYSYLHYYFHIFNIRKMKIIDMTDDISLKLYFIIIIIVIFTLFIYNSDWIN